MDNRNIRLIKYLNKNRGGITVEEAMKFLGTTELRKIVSDLRASGWNITDKWEEGFNRYGEITRYKRYFLIKSRKQKGK